MTKFAAHKRATLTYLLIQHDRLTILGNFSTLLCMSRIYVSVSFYVYRTRAIINRGLYIFYPISKDHFFVFEEVFSENSVIMYGSYSRAASNQERLMMACVQYMFLPYPPNRR